MGEGVGSGLICSASLLVWWDPEARGKGVSDAGCWGAVLVGSPEYGSKEESRDTGQPFVGTQHSEGAQTQQKFT